MLVNVYVWTWVIILILLPFSLPSSLALDNHRNTLQAKDGTGQLQKIVTWDQYAISVHGERVLLLSGEFHPFRLPSPGLWLDVFQKIRALGFSGVSFYLDWALIEGEQGQIRMGGIFALDQFFSAASEAGIYLIARPGPYINAETSGGGFPGWLGRLHGRLRTTDQDYLDAITPYISTVGGIIASAQITNGGPVILVQPENEYTLCVETAGYTQINNLTITGIESSCLEKEYMAYVENEYRKAGIVVPFIVNDAFPVGNFAPGTGAGAADIYSFDFYPLGWSTAPADPSNWEAVISPLLEYNFTTHTEISLKTPFSISEFQGGCPDAWGGVGVKTSVAYIGYEFERVFYKLNYGFRAAIHSLYMIFGGTNWGNLGYPGGYTSYDVGAAIAENREVDREKYSELKLQANFLQVSPAYLTTQPDNGTFGVYTDTHELVVTRLSGSPTSFYIVRQSNLTSVSSTSYRFNAPTTFGNLTVPQLKGTLSLNGRDSKFHVVDYNVDGINLVYSTFEILTWKQCASRAVLVMYGGEDELHEFSIPAGLGRPTTVGSGVIVHELDSLIVVQWRVRPGRRVLRFGSRLEVHLLWRNDAYNYWVLDLPAPPPLGLHVSPSRQNQSVIVKAGYLVRSAEIFHNALYLTGDINGTTDVEVISTPARVSSLFFNGMKVNTQLIDDRLTGTVRFVTPAVVLPDLEALPWRYINSLPELSSDYDDSLWTPCNHKVSNNPRNLSTPTSLYASDYGYNTGSLLYRGHFISTGTETAFYLLVEGGYAFGYTVWLNSTYLGSWKGDAGEMFFDQTLSFPEGSLVCGKPYVLTVMMDHMGIDENFPANVQIMKDPRGILDYDLYGRQKSDLSWKITGNFGAERYADLSRGPLNEGGTYAERQGYHLPGAPMSGWEIGSPFSEAPPASVRFFATTFDLQMPVGYDIPLSIVFRNSTYWDTTAILRVVIYVNGWQFGKYLNHIGPQVRYPIPEGVLNYNGENYLTMIMWASENRPAKLQSLNLEIDAVIQSGYRKPAFVRAEGYTERRDAY